MSDWYAKKFGGNQQPGGVVLRPQQPAYPQQQQPQPVYQQQPVQQQQTYQQEQQAVQQAEDPNRKLSLREAVVRFKGSEGMRTEGHLNCPSCGSKSGYTQFSGMNSAGAGVMGNKPAPHCFECGYNGKFAQGMETTWAS